MPIGWIGGYGPLHLKPDGRDAKEAAHGIFVSIALESDKGRMMKRADCGIGDAIGGSHGLFSLTGS
jgi:hypothetical protein